MRYEEVEEEEEPLEKSLTNLKDVNQRFVVSGREKEKRETNWDFMCSTSIAQNCPKPKKERKKMKENLLKVFQFETVPSVKNWISFNDKPCKASERALLIVANLLLFNTRKAKREKQRY